MKDVTTGKTLVEVTPHKLIRLVRPCRGWIITKQEMQREEERASSPVDKRETRGHIHNGFNK